MKVRLHIDRLVVEGLDVPHRGKLQAAVEHELATLIVEQGLGAITSIAVPSVRAPSIDVGGELGTNIAGAIYGAIGSRP
jgi:hypothetical protein